MTAQAQAILDVRPAEAGEAGRATKWLRGIGVRQVRLACGLVMFAYVFSHFFNHALGNISYATMETWLRFHIWCWRIRIVNFTLYAAATIALHAWPVGALPAACIFAIRRSRLPNWCSGLSIPLLIASHFGIVRLGGADVRPRSADLCRRPGGLLVAAPLHDRGAVRPDDGGLDPCLHRPLFLAAAETVFPLGASVPACHRGAAAAARDDRHPSRRA